MATEATKYIPTDLRDFFIWLRQKTEVGWEDFPTDTLEDYIDRGVGGSSYRAGTKWKTGLNDAAIDQLEQSWQIQFPEDYREFLRQLNAPDRGCYHVGWVDEPPYDLQEGEDVPSYFDWIEHKDELTDALDWPLRGLLWDVEENDLWPTSWGDRPDSPELRENVVTRLVKNAPPLVPLTGHRYLVADSLATGNPILSVWQSDIIVYATSLRGFLIDDFATLIELQIDKKQAEEIAMGGYQEERIARIPFWGEIVLNKEDHYAWLNR